MLLKRGDTYTLISFQNETNIVPLIRKATLSCCALPNATVQGSEVLTSLTIENFNRTGAISENHLLFTVIKQWLSPTVFSLIQVHQKGVMRITIEKQGGWAGRKKIMCESWAWRIPPISLRAVRTHYHAVNLILGHSFQLVSARLELQHQLWSLPSTM